MVGLIKPCRGDLFNIATPSSLRTRRSRRNLPTKLSATPQPPQPQPQPLSLRNLCNLCSLCSLCNLSSLSASCTAGSDVPTFSLSKT